MKIHVKNFFKFIGSNFTYLIWFAIYFTIAWVILGENLKSFYITAIIYGGSIGLALSPLGEILLRLMENCHIPATEQEKKYLLPLFEEVYQNAKENNPKLNDNVKIYITDAMYVNAFAIGRKTIAVTQGSIETFTKDELKGIIAHEFGHLNYGHTKALLLSVIGNMFFSFIVIVLRFLLSACEFISDIISGVNYIGWIFKFICVVVRLVFELSTFIFINFSQIILASNSRLNETQADKFAYSIGFGKQLTNALYMLKKISIGKKVKLSELLKASHPHTSYRIEFLENLMNN